jgi:PAS domain S-box-containing protein
MDRNEKFLEIVSQSLPGTFYVFDNEGRMVEWNKNVEIISGYSHDEIKDLNPIDFFADEDQKRISEAVRSGFKDGTVEVEADFYTKDCESIPFYFSASRMEIDGVPHLVGIGIDISKQKQAHQEVEKQKKLLSAIMEQSGSIIFVKDAGDKYKLVNKEFYNLFNLEEDVEINEMTDRDLFEKEVADTIAQDDRKILESGEPKTYEESIPINGELRHYLTTKYPLKDIQGFENSICGITNDITELKQLRVDLEKSEKRWRDLVDNHPIPFLLFNNHCIEYANDAACEFLGASDVSEIEGKKATEFITESETDTLNNRLYNLDLGVPTKPQIYNLIRLDGEIRKAEIYSIPENHKGKYRTVIRDVTPLKRAEEKAKERADQQQVCSDLGLMALKNTNLQDLFDKTTQMVAKTLNNEYCKIVEFIPDEDSFLLKSGVGWKKGHVGKTKVGSRKQSHSGYSLMHDEVVVVEDIEKEKRFTDFFLSDQHNVRSGIAAVIPGTRQPYGVIATHSSETKNISKNDTAFVKTVANILAAAVERLNAENLAQKRARLQLASAELGRITVTNNELQPIFDYATRLVAKTLDNEYCKVLELLPEQDELLLKSGIGWKQGYVGAAKVGAKEQSQAGYTLLQDEPVIVENIEKEKRFSGPDLLTDHNVKSGISVIIRGTDGPYGILGTHSTQKKTYTNDEVTFVESIAIFLGDTIQRLRAINKYEELNNKLEDLVKERTSQLEEANKELESFSYSVSHDLRSPLRAINGYTNLLLEDHNEDLNEEGKEFLSIVNEETNRMGELIDDLLEFSRLNRKEKELKSFSMATLVQECIDEVKKLNPDVSPIFSVQNMTSVKADRRLIKQVWTNLIGNAVKFRNPGQDPEIKISANPDMDHNQVFFHVSDNGVGFNMKYADKLFGVFQRLHNRDEFEGTGIGLALSKRIINRHGGDINAESEPGKGTTISFSLPIKAD